MRNYEVTYSIATRVYENPGSAFESRSDMSNLKIVVKAGYPDQARQIVESMFGGPQRCKTFCAWEVR